MYVIDHLLGEGAMAEVYAANDIRLRRPLAIKLSKPGSGSAFLESEGCLLGSLRHPGVVAIHGIGDYDERTYLALERLFGTTLQTQIDLRRGRPFRIDIALDLMIQLCDLVEGLHQIGVIHRDLKPDNVMATPGGRLVLFDLGVAVGTVDTYSSEMVVGTPTYLAPELLAKAPGSPTPPAPQQDVYALGCLAYQLLTGRVPYDGSTTAEIYRAHLEAPIPELASSLDGGPHLRELVRAMLAKHPEQRPASAGAIASWLRGIRRGLEMTAAPSPTSLLIVDDDPDTRELLEAIIEERMRGIEVRTAIDGQDALDQVSEQPPSIMLLDLEMPRLSGLELCMHLSANPAAAEVLMCVFSGRTGRADRSLLEQLGVRRFIDKREPADRIITGIEQLVADVEARRSAALNHAQ